MNEKNLEMRVEALEKSLEEIKAMLMAGKAEEAEAPVPLEIQVTDLLREIGVPASLKGYRYLREAIIVSVKNRGVLDAIIKELYPQVAEAFDTTPSRVERAIRHAIEAAWDRCDMDVLQKYFGNTVSMNKGKSTNSEFIAILTDLLILKEANR